MDTRQVPFAILVNIIYVFPFFPPILVFTCSSGYVSC